MNISNISWTLYGDTFEGRVNQRVLFIIQTKKTKAKTWYTLLSRPFHNTLFTRANNNKKLLGSEDLEYLQNEAQKLLNSYIADIFMKKENLNKPCKIFVAFSGEAHDWLENNNEDYTKMAKGIKGLRKGYDWDVKKFKTSDEVSAYVEGLEDGNGWTNDVFWVKTN